MSKRKPTTVMARNREELHAAQEKARNANREIQRMHEIVREERDRADRKLKAYTGALNAIYGNIVLQHGTRLEDGSIRLRVPFAMASNYSGYHLMVKRDAAAEEMELALFPKRKGGDSND